MRKPEIVMSIKFKPVWDRGGRRGEEGEGRKGADRDRVPPQPVLCVSSNTSEHQLAQLDYFFQRKGL